jgi:hypothetical protein
MKLVSILSILPILSKNQLSIGESESSQRLVSGGELGYFRSITR